MSGVSLARASSASGPTGRYHLVPTRPLAGHKSVDWRAPPDSSVGSHRHKFSVIAVQRGFQSPAEVTKFAIVALLNVALNVRNTHIVAMAYPRWLNVLAATGFGLLAVALILAVFISARVGSVIGFLAFFIIWVSGLRARGVERRSRVG